MKPYYWILPVSALDVEDPGGDEPRIAALHISDEFLAMLMSMREAASAASAQASARVDHVSFSYEVEWYNNLSSFLPSSALDDLYEGCIIKVANDFDWPVPVPALRGDTLSMTGDGSTIYLSCYEKYSGIHYESTWFDLRHLIAPEQPPLLKIIHDYDMSHAWHEDVVWKAESSDPEEQDQEEEGGSA